jgi:hypothetical protein
LVVAEGDGIARAGFEMRRRRLANEVHDKHHGHSRICSVPLGLSQWKKIGEYATYSIILDDYDLPAHISRRQK